MKRTLAGQLATVKRPTRVKIPCVPASQKLLLTIDEAASLLNMPREWVIDQIDTNELCSLELDNRELIPFNRLKSHIDRLCDDEVELNAQRKAASQRAWTELQSR
jgi:hypothetical protein